MGRAKRSEVRIGISGWRYAPWRGVFYPSGLAQRRELAFASRMLATIEMRLHGDEELYASGYSDAALDRWAHRIEAWHTGRQVNDARLASGDPAPRRTARDVFCYFDNDVKVHAPYDAAHLAQRLGLPTGLDDGGRFVVPAGFDEDAHSAAPESRTTDDRQARRAPGVNP
jgi:uncharacterized protein YecE (DUF72 family)